MNHATLLKTKLLLGVAWLFLLAPLEASLTQVNDAFEHSFLNHKPLVIYFCENRSVEFFKTEELAQEIRDLPFMIMDFSQLSPEERRGCRERYHLQKLPRLILFDEGGCEIFRYSPYNEKVQQIAFKLREMVMKSDELALAMRRLESGELSSLEKYYQIALELKKEREASLILERGVAMNSLFFLLEKYRGLSEGDERRAALRERVMAADPENREEAHYRLAVIDFQMLAASSHSREVIRPLETYLEQFGEKDHKNRWRVEMTIAQFYLNYDEWVTSLKHAEVAMKEAPLDVQKEIGKCCDYIKERMGSDLVQKE